MRTETGSATTAERTTGAAKIIRTWTGTESVTAAAWATGIALGQPGQTTWMQMETESATTAERITGAGRRRRTAVVVWMRTGKELAAIMGTGMPGAADGDMNLGTDVTDKNHRAGGGVVWSAYEASPCTQLKLTEIFGNVIFGW